MFNSNFKPNLNAFEQGEEWLKIYKNILKLSYDKNKTNIKKI